MSTDKINTRKLRDQELIAVASASGWIATFPTQTVKSKPIAFWAVNKDQECCGVVVYDISFENAASMPGFEKYTRQ